MQKFPSPLACVGFVSKHLKNLKLIDGSWYMPQMGRNADAEFLKARIPGAVRFDIDSVCRKDTTLPHMVPP
jgi:thiosulfate/3-mercaptopyruvate sulfurtransferase